MEYLKLVSLVCHSIVQLSVDVESNYIPAGCEILDALREWEVIYVRGRLNSGDENTARAL